MQVRNFCYRDMSCGCCADARTRKAAGCTALPLSFSCSQTTKVSDLGFGVEGLGLGLQIQGFGLELEVEGLGFEVGGLGSEFRMGPQVLEDPSPSPHAPEVKMTVVKQTPSGGDLGFKVGGFELGVGAQATHTAFSSPLTTPRTMHHLQAPA